MTKFFLPMSKEDLQKRGWDGVDIILITGDAYVDHPSYGAAVIGRFLESKGYRVGVMAQPDWRGRKDFLALGRPKLFFAITAGNADSMVANYTANKKTRKIDDYSPGGKAGLRPDRATIVYTNRAKEIFKEVPVVIGGMEASMRRLAHYDYWDNSARRSILLDSKADILVYGMGERQILAIAERVKNKKDMGSINDIPGTTIIRKDLNFLKDYVTIPSFEEIKNDKLKFAEAFKIIYSQMNPFTAKAVVQKHRDRFVVQLPPDFPLTTNELDFIYELPYARNWHPAYDKAGGVKGFETVRFSMISHRGCCGECSFCSLYFHQGRIIQSRSQESILREAKTLTQQKYFRGTITDIGGPTANLYMATCCKWDKTGFCDDVKCLATHKCENLKLGYSESLKLYKKVRELPGVKHVFIGSGFRGDLLADEYADEYLTELCRYHISGQMKVAPEHISGEVLKLMNKPNFAVYEKFTKKFALINKKLGKDQYLVNYFISGHPGATLKDAFKLAAYLHDRGIHPEQIQDFLPLPMTLAGCFYYTRMDPLTGRPVYVPDTFRERKAQRALIQNRGKRGGQLAAAAIRRLKSESKGKRGR